MTKHLVSGTICLALCFAIAEASLAQTVESRGGTRRGLFGGTTPRGPNQPSQEFDITLNTLGGFDDAFLPGGDGDLAVEAPSAYHGTGEVAVRYWRGRTDRSFQLNGGGFSNLYSIGEPLYGGNVQAQAETTVGRSLRLQGRQAVRYEPLLSIGGFGPLETGVEPIALNASSLATGLTAQRSRRLESAALVSQNWTRRQESTVTVDHGRYDDLSGFGYDSRSRSASAQHSWSVSRSTQVQGSYRYSNVAITGGPSIQAPTVAHGIDVGSSYDRRISRSRRIAFSFGGGATRIQSTSEDGLRADRWTPSGYGSVNFDFGRTWSARGNYNRASTALAGVGGDTFFSDAVAVNLTGQPTRSLTLTTSVALSSGRTTGTGGAGRYQSVTGMGQMEWLVSRCCSALVTYRYYDYQLDQVTAVAGIPTTFNRNTIQIGFSTWLPLYGSFGGRSERTGRGR